MAYLIDYTSLARRQIKALDRPIQARVITRIGSLSDDPRPTSCTKLSGHSLWRIRVGDYRIVYAIDDKAERIEIAIVAHRRESYRGL